MTKPIPEGYHALTPYLIVKRGAEAIEFYVRAFGAVERERMQDPGGKIRHAEITIGDSRVMLADEHPEIGALGPETIGGSPVGLHLYVEDVDAVVARAIAAGATLTRAVADQFYGDRIGGVTDPFGHRWSIATHKEDLSMDEIRRRGAAQGH
jgi:PhnB protein